MKLFSNEKPTEGVRIIQNKMTMAQKSTKQKSIERNVTTFDQRTIKVFDNVNRYLLIFVRSFSEHFTRSILIHLYIFSS